MQRSRPSPSFWVITCAALLAFIGVVIHAWRIARPLSEISYIPKEEVITPEIRLLQAYIRIDTSNPPGKELPGAQFLVDELARRGVRAELIESSPGRANVYARLEGRSEDGGLLLLNHIDVFPADARPWSEPPFEARTKMNQIYGRGALDMKSTAICELVAFCDLAASGVMPEKDVVFLATADEEEGGHLGIAWLLERRPDIFEGIDFAINEGGISETLEEELTYFGIEVGTRQIVRLRLRSKQRRDLELARTALLPLQDRRDPDRVLPEVVSILKSMSDYRKANNELLRDVDKTIANGDFYRLQVPVRALFVNTVSPGGIRAIPGGGFEMEVVLNNLPDELPEKSVAVIRKLVTSPGVDVIVEELQGPAPITPVTTPLFEVLRRSVGAEYGPDIFVGPIILPFSSNDSRYLRARGIHAYGISPFPVNLYQTWGIHAVDERVRLDWFVQGVNLMRRIVRDYAAGQPLSQ